MTGQPLPYLWVFLPRLAEQNKVPWESEWDEHPQGRSYSGVKSTGFQGVLTHAHIPFFGCMMVYACIQQCNVATNDLRKHGNSASNHHKTLEAEEDPKSYTTFDRLGNNVWTHIGKGCNFTLSVGICLAARRLGDGLEAHVETSASSRIEAQLPRHHIQLASGTSNLCLHRRPRADHCSGQRQEGPRANRRDMGFNRYIGIQSYTFDRQPNIDRSALSSPDPLARLAAPRSQVPRLVDAARKEFNSSDQIQSLARTRKTKKTKRKRSTGRPGSSEMDRWELDTTLTCKLVCRAIQLKIYHYIHHNHNP